ncbi:MAG: hypothetical protein CL916_08890 [Deltaproteobacteria bacterium]|nr:hypothetical protein [Deltaproteobacteria bacterium]
MKNLQTRFSLSVSLIELSLRCLRRPRMVLFIFFALLSVSLFFIRNLTIDNDPRTLAPIDDAREQANEQYEKIFGPDDTSIIVVISGDNSSVLLKSLVTVTAKLEQDPQIIAVLSAANIKRTVTDDSGVKRLISPIFGTSDLGDHPTEQIESIRNWSGASNLISSDGRHVFVTLQLDDDVRDPIAAMYFLRTLEQSITTLLPKEIEVHIGGLVATRAASVEAIMRDSIFLFPLSGLIVFFVTYWRFRSIRYTLILLGTMNWSIVMTAGCASIMSLPLTPLSQLFPILIMIIGIADGVHLLEAFERAEGDFQERWSHSLKQTGVACYLTTCTTIVGFLSLLLTQIPILHEFSFVLSLGIGFALISNMFLLPAACLVFCSHLPRVSMTNAYRFGNIAVWAYRNGTKSIYLGISLIFLCLYMCTQIKIDYFLTKILSEDHPVAHGNEILEEHFGGSIPIEISVYAEHGDFHEQHNLKQLDRLSTFIANQIGTVSSHSHALKNMNREIIGDFTIPKTKEEAIELTNIYQEIIPFSFLSQDQTHTRISGLTRDYGTKELLKLQDKLHSFDAASPEIHLQMVGAMIGAAEGFDTLVTELLLGLLGALSLIIIIIGVYLRSMTMAFISVMPNSLPILLGIAFFPVTGQHLDIFSAVFFTIALGISVDDTIHMIKHFENNLKEGKPIEETISKTASEIGSAIANTSWILVSGFVVLLLSEFPANRTSGALVAGLISSAFICDLIFVPAAISLFQWRKKI